MKKTPRILVVGSFVMDLIVSAPRFPQTGETVLGTSYQTAPGGKGANQAVQAARLGAAVTMVGKVGADAFGHALRVSAEASGVDVSQVIVSSDSFTAIGNVQLEQEADGSTANRIIVVPGANTTITAEEVAYLEQTIGEYDLVMLQLEIPMEINVQIAAYARSKGVPVMLNSAPFAPLPQELMKSITYISPNETEAERLTGIKVDSDEAVRQALAILREMGVPNALITLGSRGAAYLDREGELSIVPAVPDLQVQDPTAAGDSFVGAFSTAVSAGLPMNRVLTFANYAAAITVTRMGAQPSLPTLEEVLERMEERGENTEDYKGAFYS